MSSQKFRADRIPARVGEMESNFLIYISGFSQIGCSHEVLKLGKLSIGTYKIYVSICIFQHV